MGNTNVRSVERRFMHKNMKTKKVKFVQIAIHKIKHLFGWNNGEIISFWKKDKLFICFKCECGKVKGCHCANHLWNNLKGPEEEA